MILALPSSWVSKESTPPKLLRAAHPSRSPRRVGLSSAQISCPLSSSSSSVPPNCPSSRARSGRRGTPLPFSPDLVAPASCRLFAASCLCRGRPFKAVRPPAPRKSGKLRRTCAARIFQRRPLSARWHLALRQPILEMGFCRGGELRCAPQDPSGLPRGLPLSEASRQAWARSSHRRRGEASCRGQLLDSPQAATLPGITAKQDFVQQRVSARHVWPFFSEPQGEESLGVNAKSATNLLLLLRERIYDYRRSTVPSSHWTSELLLSRRSPQKKSANHPNHQIHSR